MKKIGISVVVLTAIAGALLYFLRNKDAEPRYRTERVARGDIVMTVTATGTVNPVTTVLVGTQVSGTIKNIYVDFNSPVKKGQLIAQIDPASFLAQVAQARANLYAAKANLEKSEATLVDAKRTWERNSELFAKNLIARSELDAADTNYETAKASVSAARSQIAQTEAAFEFAETNLRYTRIISPVDGVVISRNVDVGQTVAASFQTPTLFTIAQDLTKMQIDTNVDEADIGKVQVAQEVEFSVDAYPEVVFHGKVWQIRNAPITVQNVVTYDVVLQVDNPALKLKPGMTANVSIIIATKKNVLKIPNAALRFRLDQKEKKTAEQQGAGVTGVWKLEQGRPERVAIIPGISDGSYTEITNDSLREGEEVIVESMSKNQKTLSAPPGPRFF